MNALDLQEKVLELVQDYIDNAGQVLDTDILLDAATITGIAELDKKLIKDIEQLDTDEEPNLIIIDLENMVLRDKLENFLRSEIFPHFRTFDEKVNGL